MHLPTALKRFGPLALALVFFHTTALAAENALVPYRAGMQAVIQGFNQRDHRPFSRAVDIDAILDVALDDYLLKKSFKDDFRDSFRQTGAEKLGQNIVSSLAEGGTARLIHLKQAVPGAQALIRLDFGNAGNGYMILDLVTDQAGKIRIVDWFDYSTGQKYTQSLRQLVALVSPTPTFVGKVFDLATDKEEKTQSILELFKRQQQGDHRGVVELFLAMDEELKQSRALNFFAVQAANMSGDDQLYLKTLSNVEKYFADDPALQFVLVDYYFLTGDYDQAVAALEGIHEDFGAEDAAIYTMIANAHFQAGALEPAVSNASRAIDVEPNYENGYWTLFSIHIESKKWKDAVAVARLLESKFGYDLGPENLMNAGGYEPFVESKPYKRWKSGS